MAAASNWSTESSLPPCGLPYVILNAKPWELRLDEIDRMSGERHTQSKLQRSSSRQQARLPTACSRHQHRPNGFHHRPPGLQHHRPSPGDRRGGAQGRVQEEPRDYGASNSHGEHTRSSASNLAAPESIPPTLRLDDVEGGIRADGTLGGRVDSWCRDGRRFCRRRFLFRSVITTTTTTLPRSEPPNRAAYRSLAY